MVMVCHPPPESPVRPSDRDRLCSRLRRMSMPAFHGQEERCQPTRATEVELVHAVVEEAIGAQLAHAQPLNVQSEHAALGLIDATVLLGVVDLALGAVPVDVENHRYLAFEVLGLVEKGGCPQAWQDFVAKLLDPIAGATFDCVDPLDACFGVTPLDGLCRGKRHRGARLRDTRRLSSSTLLPEATPGILGMRRRSRAARRSGPGCLREWASKKCR